MLDRSGSFIIEMGPFEYGSTADDPICEAYEMANKFYEEPEEKEEAPDICDVHVARPDLNEYDKAFGLGGCAC